MTGMLMEKEIEKLLVKLPKHKSYDGECLKFLLITLPQT